MRFAMLAIVAWGFWGLWGKIALQRGMPSHAIMIAEGVMGFGCGLLVLALLYWRRLPLPWDQPLNLYGFLSGGALAAGIGCYYVALRNENLSLIVPLTAAYPVIAVLLGMLFLGERLSLLQWAGVSLTVLGCMLLTVEPPA